MVDLTKTRIDFGKAVEVEGVRVRVRVSGSGSGRVSREFVMPGWWNW